MGNGNGYDFLGFWTFWFFLCLIAFGFWPGSVLVASVLVVAWLLVLELDILKERALEFQNQLHCHVRIGLVEGQEKGKGWKKRELKT